MEKAISMPGTANKYQKVENNHGLAIKMARKDLSARIEKALFV